MAREKTLELEPHRSWAFNRSSVKRHPAFKIASSFVAAIVLVAALQPLYVAALMATDYVAPPALRIRTMAPSMRLLADTNGDTTTECIALGVGLEPNSTPFRNAVLATYPFVQNDSCEGLAAAIQGKPVQWVTYARYWHGYRLVLDPLTAFVRINDSRYIALTFLVLSLIWFSLELKKLAGEHAALAFSIPTLLLSDLWRMFQITANSVATTVIFCGGAVMASKARANSIGAHIITAALLGSVFNFVDFLTNPPWQPMLIAFVVLIGGRTIVETLLVLIAWVLGYALTWVSKWLIAVLAGEPWSQISKVIFFRINGDYQDQISHYLFAPTAKALPFLVHDIMWQGPTLVILAILIPTLARRRATRWNTMAKLATPALIPLVWFEVMSNHTQLHAWFTFRPLASAIGIVFAAWVIASEAYEQQDNARCRSVR